jgi:ABC-type lipoprotein release transport system permease subunit
VGLLAGHEIRRRWRSALALVVLIGIVGALVLATVAGARRSGTALERFNRESRSSQLEIAIEPPTERELEEFRSTPGVEALAHLRGYALVLGEFEELAIAAPLDAAMEQAVDRSRLLEGRRPDPDAPLETTIGEQLAHDLGIGLGDRLRAVSYTNEQIDVAFSGGDPGPPGGPPVAFEVVGIVRRPLDLGVRAASGGVVVLTPAFAREYDDRVGAWTDVLRVRTDGVAAGNRATNVARRLWDQDSTFQIQGLGIETEGARNAISVLTTALWIVAGVATLAGIVAIGIVLSRNIRATDLDQTVLRGLGLTHGQRARVHAPRTLLICGAGALLAGLGAIALSPRFPVGLARQADPDVGVHVDWTVLGGGVALLVVLTAAIAAVAAYRTARAAASDRELHAYRWTSHAVERAAETGLRPTTVNGLRMAVQAGRGRQAIPVRSAVVGAIAGVAGITAAIVFAASLTHLIDTPRLYGWSWDISAEVGTDRQCGDTGRYGLTARDGVAAMGFLCSTYTGIELDHQHNVTVWGLRSTVGDLEPEIVAGRAPAGPREIALGSVTMDKIGKGIGDTVRARAIDEIVEYRIVGQVVLPTVGSPQALADGAIVAAAGFGPLQESGENETHYLVVRAAPGTDIDALRAKVASIDRVRNVRAGSVPVEVSRLEQIDAIPAALGILLAALALVAVAHAVVSTVRRRRADLAVLKVLGFTRGQVRTTIAWQTTVLGAIGLLVGIPVGVILGRGAWQLVADGLGVVPAVQSPVLWLLVVIPGALLVVNALAVWPARSAARTRPAAILRET